MAKFRKKPVVVEAHQWFKNGDHPDDACYYIDDKSPDRFLSEGKVVRRFRRPDIDGQSRCSECGHIFHDHGWIDTLEGGHRVCPGDWIITGVKGEKYPCKDEIFRMTYEPIAERKCGSKLSVVIGGGHTKSVSVAEADYLTAADVKDNK